MAEVEGGGEGIVACAFLAIVFDLDGTLVDLERLHHEAHLYAARAFGLVLTWNEAFERLEHFVGGPDERVAAEIAELAPKSVPPQVVLELKRQRFLSLLNKVGTVELRDGARDVVEWLTTRGIGLGVGTVTDRAVALRILDRANLLPLFSGERLVAREDVSQLKPAPDVYLETARRLGVEPIRQLVFEDSVPGVRAARLSGSRVVALPTVRYSRFVRAIASAGAEMIFSSWRDRELWSFLKREVCA